MASPWRRVSWRVDGGEASEAVPVPARPARAARLDFLLKDGDDSACSLARLCSHRRATTGHKGGLSSFYIYFFLNFCILYRGAACGCPRAQSIFYRATPEGEAARIARAARPSLVCPPASPPPSIASISRFRFSRMARSVDRLAVWQRLLEGAAEWMRGDMAVAPGHVQLVPSGSGPRSNRLAEGSSSHISWCVHCQCGFFIYIDVGHEAPPCRALRAPAGRCALVCERLRCEPWRPWGWDGNCEYQAPCLPLPSAGSSR